MFVLADTSAWITHFHGGHALLSKVIAAQRVVIHPLVVGEIACGILRSREEILHRLSRLPVVTIASNSEVLRFIEAHRLFGRGIGIVDANLLASTVLDGCRLLTDDKRLAEAAKSLELDFRPAP